MRMPKIIRACKGTTFLALSMPLTEEPKKSETFYQVPLSDM